MLLGLCCGIAAEFPWNYCALMNADNICSRGPDATSDDCGADLDTCKATVATEPDTAGCKNTLDGGSTWKDAAGESCVKYTYHDEWCTGHLTGGLTASESSVAGATSGKSGDADFKSTPPLRQADRPGDGFIWKVVTSGTCASNGCRQTGSVAECKAGATAVGVDAAAVTLATIQLKYETLAPTGCYIGSGTKAHFNKAGFSTTQFGELWNERWGAKELVVATGTALAGTSGVGSTVKLNNEVPSNEVSSGYVWTTDTYPGATISFTEGTGAGQTSTIKTYDSATKVATLFPNLGVAPDSSTKYSIVKIPNVDCSGGEGGSAVACICNCPGTVGGRGEGCVRGSVRGPL